jgi:hypothetical protein
MAENKNSNNGEGDKDKNLKNQQVLKDQNIFIEKIKKMIP